MREFEKKYMIEVQGENSRKFNYYTECVSHKNIRIANKKLKRFVTRSSRAPPSIVQNSFARRPSFIYMLKKGKKQCCFAILKTALKRQRICNTCLHEKLVDIHKLSNGILCATFQ